MISTVYVVHTKDTIQYQIERRSSGRAYAYLPDFDRSSHRPENKCVSTAASTRRSSDQRARAAQRNIYWARISLECMKNKQPHVAVRKRVLDHEGCGTCT